MASFCICSAQGKGEVPRMKSLGEEERQCPNPSHHQREVSSGLMFN